MPSRKTLKASAAAAGAVLLLLAAIVAYRALRLPSRQVSPEAVTLIEPMPGSPERLAGALQIPTVSHADRSQRRAEPFAEFSRYLERVFPRAHATLALEKVGDALLYTWHGSEESLPPVVLMGHFDVVPVETAGERSWTHPPFGGRIADGYVWGRGALDDKQTVLGIMEAVEALLVRGFRPRRTAYLAFGADEEVGGREGAARIAALLKARGIRPGIVLDEGGVVGVGLVPGVRAPVALVGVAEKGIASVEMTARDPGGHSSMPPKRTAVGRVSRAVAALEDSPMPARLIPANAEFFAHVAPEMPLGMRAVFANQWLFKPVILRQLSASPTTDATIRTTTAPTMLDGSPKENVLASRARAVVNFRILPGDTVAGVLDHVRRTIDDPELQVELVGESSEPSPPSRVASPAWQMLTRTIRQVYPSAVVAPYLVVGATDARHFRAISEDVYRFVPITMGREDLGRAHGLNERLAVEQYLRAIRFYAQFLSDALAWGTQS